MVDGDFNVWLLEANTNPCLEESSKILENLLPRMIDDMFKLTLDQVFKSSNMKTNRQIIGNSNLMTSVLRQRGEFAKANEQCGNEEILELERPSPFRVGGYSDSFNIW